MNVYPIPQSSKFAILVSETVMPDASGDAAPANSSLSGWSTGWRVSASGLSYTCTGRLATVLAIFATQA